MSVLRDDLIPGKVLHRRKWRKCLFRDNGDGTALAVFGKQTVIIGRKVYTGTMHTVRIEDVTPA